MISFQRERDVRRAFLALVVVGGVFVALTGILSAEGTRYGQGLPARFFEFTYRAEVSGIPPGAKEVQVWVPVAKSNGYQKIHERKIQTGHSYQLLKESEYDNEVLYVKLDRAVPERVVLQVDYGVSVNGHEEGVQRLEPAVQENFLKSQRLMVVNEMVRRIAERVTNGKRSNREKARALYQYVLEHMKYDKSGTGWGRGDTIRACAVGTGNCTDFHSLFVSLARASGIPSRFHMGASIPKEEGQKISGYHCWADFYSEEGWVPVDISEAWKHPERANDYLERYEPNRILLSVGRDLHLPMMRSEEPVNFLVDPYVEIDGRPFDSVQTVFEYRNLNRPKEDWQ